MALSDIDRTAVLLAINEFDRVGRDQFLEKYGFRRSRSYFLRHGGNFYDSKAIIGVAHGFSGRERRPLESAEFTGGDTTVARRLRELGFDVQVLDSAPTTSPDSNVCPEGFAFWWVNNKQTYTQEIGGNYLWSPTEKRDGSHSVFYENMKRVRTGDVIFAYAGGAIRAVGICSAPAILAPKPEEFGAAGEVWSGEGWRLSVKFTRLSEPLRPKDHMHILAATLPGKYSPIRPDGDGNQVAYLAAVPVGMAQAVISLLGDRWNEIDRAVVLDENHQIEALEATNDQIERTLRNRTDIGETEKLQLIKSRRGQGVYRQNLESFEKACRVTGVGNRRHLRASHIKPWRVSNTVEKLDGNNGLLLSPHVDHLFDQGFISFTDKGTLLVSPQADVDTLILWGIDLDGNFGPFRPAQFNYLAFHREFVFRKHPLGS